MKSKKLRQRLQSSREKGIALLFTLGVLGIMMVIIVTFAMTSSTERKVSAANNNIQGARFLAKSALERVLGALSADSSRDASTLMSKTLSGGTDDGNKNIGDWIWKLDTANILLLNDPDNAPTWQFVKAHDAALGKDLIIGRFAFMSVGAGRINLKSTVDHSYCIADGTCSGTAENVGCRRRLGISPAEIDYEKLVRIDPADSAICSESGNLAAFKEQVKDNMNADSHESLFNHLTGLTSQDKAAFLKYFDVSNSTKDQEVYYVGKNVSHGGLSADEIKKKESFHRLYLRRGSTSDETIGVWDHYTVETLCDSEKIKCLFDNAAWNNDDNAQAIHFFAYQTDDVAGTFSSVEAKRKQVAANFLQYCRPGTSKVISDVDPSLWQTFGSEPKYTGLKRTAYINEAGLIFTVNVTKSNEHPNGEGVLVCDIAYDIEAKAYGEIVDIYHGSAGKDYTLWFLMNNDRMPKIKIKNPTDGSVLEYPYSTGTARSASAVGTGLYNDQTAFSEPRLDFSSVSAESGYYYKKESETLPLFSKKFTDVPSSSANNIGITFSGITQLNLLLGEGSNFEDNKKCDFSNLPEMKTEHEVSGLTLDTPHYVKFFWETEDPRQNLNPGDWTFRDEVSGDPGYASVSTLGKVNTNGAACENKLDAGGNPASNEKDAETATDPGNGSPLSTAYIRHASMESPWELGLIHRGVKWQTINLTKAASINSTDLENSAMGMGKYTDGDGQLLDQIKMNKDVEVLPKINMNNSANFTHNGEHNHILSALFPATLKSKPYTMKSGYAVEEDNTTTAVADSDLETLIKSFKTQLLDSDGKLFSRRGDLLRQAGTTTKALHMSQTTDSMREQMIGRTVNLMKIGPVDRVQVVILAQTITDINGTVFVRAKETDYASGYVRKDGTAFKRSSESAKFNQPDSSDYGVYKPGVDRITGEAKIVANLIKKDGVWKIERYEYVDE